MHDRPTPHRALRLAILLLALGPSFARAGVNRWTSGGPFFGSLTALVADPTNPDVLYAGAYGRGVFRSADGGTTWQPINQGLQDLNVSSLAIDPAHPSTIYVGTSRFVNRSVDSGGHWESQYTYENTNDAITVLAIAPSAPATVYAGTTYGVVRRTTDGGCSWGDPGVGLVAFDGITALAVDPSNPDVVYAGTAFHQAYKSLDGGATWTPQAAGLVYPAVYSIAVDPTDPQTLYAATSFFSEVDGSQGGGVFKTYDGGVNWFPLPYSLPNRAYRSVQIAPGNPAVAYAAALGGGVFRTANAGVTWSPRDSGLVDADGSGLALTGDGSTLFASMAAGVFRSTDSALHWDPASTGLPIFTGSALVLDPAAPQTIYAAGRVPGAAVCRSNDAGAHWTTSAAGLPSSTIVLSLAMNPADSANLYAGTAVNGVFRSNDGGTGWAATAPLFPGLRTQVLALAVDPFTPATVYASTDNGFLRSDDGGKSWNPTGTVPVLAAVPDASTEGRLLASVNGTMESSVNFGDTWQPSSTGIETVLIYSLAQSPTDPLVFLAGTYADSSNGIAAVYRSADGGASWTPAAGIPQSLYLYGAAFAFDPENVGFVYAILGPGNTPADAGVYRSEDGGQTWAPFPFATPQAPPGWPSALAVSGGSTLLHAATQAGVYELEPSIAGAPKILALSSTSGPPAGGTFVELFGSTFLPGATVTIGGVPAQDVQFHDVGRLTFTTPPRPSGAADVVVANPDTQSDTLRRGFAYDYADVAPSDPTHDAVIAVTLFGISGGCGSGSFCPTQPTTRGQAAVQIEKALNGSDYVYPPQGIYFTDVDLCSGFGPYIDAFFSSGISAGCGPRLFCPGQALTRAQIAVLILRAEHGSAYVPPPATGNVFADVQPGDFAADYIEEFAAEGVTAGCGGGNYCPNSSVTRAQLAVFLLRALLGT